MPAPVFLCRSRSRDNRGDNRVDYRNTQRLLGCVSPCRQPGATEYDALRAVFVDQQPAGGHDPVKGRGIVRSLID